MTDRVELRSRPSLHPGNHLLMQRMVALVRPQSNLLSNATFVTMGSVAGAVLGFLFWSIASRRMTPNSVGITSAAISAMSLVAATAEIGLGTLLLGYGLRNRKEAPHLISAAMIVGLGLSAAGSLASLILTKWLGLKIGYAVGSHMASALFVIGAVATTLSRLIDSALTGFLISSLRMYREFVFSVVKLALLFFAFMPVLGQGQEATILLFWGGALVISILFVTAVTCRSGRLWQAPDFGLLISLLPKSFGHHFLNLVASAPAIAMPLLVAEVVSPEVNAAFFMSWMILQVILLGPASLATALYAAGPPKPDGLPDAATDRLRISLVISVLMCLAGTLGFLIFLNPMLALISPLLAQIGGPYLKYLGWGMFAEAAKYHYIAVMRLQTRMWRGSILVALIGLLEILGASAGGMIAGLPGLVFGWLLTVSLQAVLVLPTLLCASGVALCSTRSERDGGV